MSNSPTRVIVYTEIDHRLEDTAARIVWERIDRSSMKIRTVNVFQPSAMDNNQIISDWYKVESVHKVFPRARRTRIYVRVKE